MDKVKSSTGTQQGCLLSNPLFAFTMGFDAQKFKSIKGLKINHFFWDDTALVGTPEAVAEAARTIQNLSAETRLHLKWKKCHLYEMPQVIEKCKSLAGPSFPKDITFHPSFNMIYLKAPIGSDEFVSGWLKDKLEDLKDMAKLLGCLRHMKRVPC